MNVIIYQGKNGTRVDLKSADFETMWATQEQIGDIFDRDKSVISKHIANIFEENELQKESSIAKFAIDTPRGPYSTDHYNLDIIIAVGYRVNSAKATQFRIWATKILKEYIVKGFAMDDERLKDPSKNQYFRELLERVREIRASEKLFYQQVRDIYATAIDYEEKKDKEEVQKFFATVRNKLLYAITHKTAAELIIERHNINDENFGLMNWEGSVVRIGDTRIGTNYLNKKELEQLKLLVNQLLDYLESQTLKEKPMMLKNWEIYTNKLIEFNEYDILKDTDSKSADYAKKIIDSDFVIFDSRRILIEKEKAEKEAVEDLKKITKEVKDILTKKVKSSKKEQTTEEKTIEEIIKNNENLKTENNKDFEKSLNKVFKFKKS